MHQPPDNTDHDPRFALLCGFLTVEADSAVSEAVNTLIEGNFTVSATTIGPLVRDRLLAALRTLPEREWCPADFRMIDTPSLGICFQFAGAIVRVWKAPKGQSPRLDSEARRAFCRQIVDPQHQQLSLFQEDSIAPDFNVVGAWSVDRNSCLYEFVIGKPELDDDDRITFAWSVNSTDFVVVEPFVCLDDEALPIQLEDEEDTDAADDFDAGDGSSEL